MLKNLVWGSPRSERAGKSPCAAARKLRAVVESLEGRTLMSVAVMSVAVSGVAHRVRPTPAEVTKVTSSRVTSNLASPDAATATVINRRQPAVRLRALDLSFDTPLLNEINYLFKKSGYDEAKDPLGRKALLLNLALVNYERLLGKNTSTMKASDLTDVGQKPGDYVITSGDPKYFGTPFNKYNNKITIGVNRAGRYDYSQATPTKFWVDAANHKLGGGVFGDGFAQEETMFLETPELANAAAQTPSLYTRTGKGDTGPLEGDPTPWIFVGANRVMAIDPFLAEGSPRENENWRKLPVADLIKYDVAQSKAQPINVLAMAAPKLPKNPTKAQQAALPVVKDLFNTFDAGFELAKRAPGVGGMKTIETVPIGTGIYNNSKVVVYVTESLAAMQVNVNLDFWGFTDAQKAEANGILITILKTVKPGTTTISDLLKIASDELKK